MISKDLDESCLDISDKFFSEEALLWELIIEWYLDAPQRYLAGNSGFPYTTRYTLTFKYSWFTLLPGRTVRKDLRPKKSKTCDDPLIYVWNRQSHGYPGLRAGTLYEDKVSRWLGIENYLVRASRRDNRTIIDFEHFRFPVCPSPVCPRNRPQIHIIPW